MCVQLSHCVSLHLLFPIHISDLFRSTNHCPAQSFAHASCHVPLPSPTALTSSCTHSVQENLSTDVLSHQALFGSKPAFLASAPSEVEPEAYAFPVWTNLFPWNPQEEGKPGVGRRWQIEMLMCLPGPVMRAQMSFLGTQQAWEEQGPLLIKGVPPSAHLGSSRSSVCSSCFISCAP